MTYLQFVHNILDPIGVQIFPASGNLYFNHVRVGYLDFDRPTKNQEVNFFRPASIPHTIGPDRSEEEKLRDIVKQLTALSVIHSVEIRNIRC